VCYVYYSVTFSLGVSFDSSLLICSSSSFIRVSSFSMASLIEKTNIDRTSATPISINIGSLLSKSLQPPKKTVRYIIRKHSMKVINHLVIYFSFFIAILIPSGLRICLTAYIYKIFEYHSVIIVYVAEPLGVPLICA